MKTNFQNQKGQSLFEVIVAIAVSALIITAIVSLASNSIQNSSFSRDKTLAANYVQATNEWLRQERDKNTSAFIVYAQTSPLWCFEKLLWVSPSHVGACSASNDFIEGTKFIRQSTFSFLLGGKKVQVNTIVSWQDSKGSHQVNGSTELSVVQ